MTASTMTVEDGSICARGTKRRREVDADPTFGGIYRQDSGDILADGRPVYENVDVKSRIACIPDDIFYFMQANTRT